MRQQIVIHLKSFNADRKQEESVGLYSFIAQRAFQLVHRKAKYFVQFVMHESKCTLLEHSLWYITSAQLAGEVSC